MKSYEPSRCRETTRNLRLPSIYPSGCRRCRPINSLPHGLGSSVFYNVRLRAEFLLMCQSPIKQVLFTCVDGSHRHSARTLLITEAASCAKSSPQERVEACSFRYNLPPLSSPDSTNKGLSFLTRTGRPIQIPLPTWICHSSASLLSHGHWPQRTQLPSLYLQGSVHDWLSKPRVANRASWNWEIPNVCYHLHNVRQISVSAWSNIRLSTKP